MYKFLGAISKIEIIDVPRKEAFAIDIPGIVQAIRCDTHIHEKINTHTNTHAHTHLHTLMLFSTLYGVTHTHTHTSTDT